MWRMYTALGISSRYDDDAMLARWKKLPEIDARIVGIVEQDYLHS